MPDIKPDAVKDGNLVKIRLLHNLPVDPKHEAKEGNVYKAELVEGSGRGSVRFWIIGATGEPLGVLAREAEVLKNEAQP